jgi:hypothetical protein
MPHIPIADLKGYVDMAHEDALWARKHKPEDVNEHLVQRKQHFLTLRRVARAKIRKSVRGYVRRRQAEKATHGQGRTRRRRVTRRH